MDRVRPVENFVGFVIRSNEGFVAIFPDVPDCRASGASVTEAIINGQEALGRHFEVLARRDQAIPRPFTDTIELGDDIVARFSARVRVPGSTVRISVRMDETLLRQIDALGGSRSAFVNQAVREKLRTIVDPTASPKERAKIGARNDDESPEPGPGAISPAAGMAQSA